MTTISNTLNGPEISLYKQFQSNAEVRLRNSAMLAQALNNPSLNGEYLNNNFDAIRQLVDTSEKVNAVMLKLLENNVDAETVKIATEVPGYLWGKRTVLKKTNLAEVNSQIQATLNDSTVVAGLRNMGILPDLQPQKTDEVVVQSNVSYKTLGIVALIALVVLGSGTAYATSAPVKEAVDGALAGMVTYVKGIDVAQVVTDAQEWASKQLTSISTAFFNQTATSKTT